MKDSIRGDADPDGELESLRQRVSDMESAEATYRELFELSGVAIVVLDSGRLTEGNARAFQVFGGSPEEMIGRSPAEFSPPRQPDGLLSVEKGRRLMRAALAGQPQSFEWRHCRMDGTPFDAEVFLAALGAAGGTKAQAILRDVTEERRAQRSLAESENMLKLVLDTIPVRVFWKDIYLNYLGCNRAFARDAGLVAPDEIRGRNDFQLRWTEQEAELYREDDRKVIESETAKLSYEEPQSRSGGGPLWLRTSKIPLRNPDGEIVGVLGAYEDITEQKRVEEERRLLEAQLRHDQKLESLGLLAGGIARDFNNLLMAILGNADLARDTMPAESRARGHLGEIVAAARRAAELCNRMLAYSGKGRFVIERIDLNRVVREMTHLLEVTVPKKTHLSFGLNAEVPAIEADAVQIRQVCMNLVTNAAEAIGEEGGRIVIRTGSRHCDREELAATYLDEGLPAGPYAYLEVTDDGCGMEGATKERIFDPFFTTKFTGRGLGLAAVLGIVRGHRGAIKVESAPGRGSTFLALFPEAVRDAPRPSGEAADPVGWHGEGTVLLVDDEPSVIEVGREMLHRIGFHVLVARDGREALGIFRRDAREGSCEIRCVLLDLTMPRMDGEQTFRALRAIRSEVPVVLTSGYHPRDVTRRFEGQGIAGFLQKPYRTATLRRELRRILDPDDQDDPDDLDLPG